MTTFAHEVHPPLVYQRQPNDISEYSGSRRLFAMAARELGVNLTDREFEDWGVSLDAAMLLDHLLDVEKTEIVTPFRNLVGGQLRDDLDTAKQIRIINYMTEMSPEQRRFIFDSVHRVNDLTIAQRQATNPTEVVDIRITEAEILTAILMLHEQGTDDDEARLKFNQWLAGWSRSGYTVDTFLDRHEDYKLGLSNVVPTIKVAHTYGATAMSESLRAIKNTPPQLLGKCALVATKYFVGGKRVQVETLAA